MLQRWTFIIFLIGVCNLQAQPLQYPATNSEDLPEWVKRMYAEDSDPDDVQQVYDIYYSELPFIKDQHTQFFKRWKRSLARFPAYSRMSAREKDDFLYKKQNYLQKSRQLQQQRSPSSQWQGIGPFDFDKTAASTSYACGAAHVYTIEQAKSNTDILYAGTATAGVWKSTDKGQNWSLCTGNEWMTSVRAIEIDHSDPQIVYAASDLDNKLYKTTDGGASWQIIGDATFNSKTHYIPDIRMHPDLTNVLLLASSEGLYRTADGGNTWQQIDADIFQEIEFHPHLSNIVYAIKQVSNKTEFYKSTDNGISFVHKPNGWPVPNIVLDEQKRTEIAVSPADSNKIYALLTGAVGFGSGLYGIFVSNDAGENWSSVCCGAHLLNFPSASNQNLMHWYDDGTGNGGQYYYDLALAVSPTNADSVLVAGVNLWVSSDGANSFSCPAQWNHSYKGNYVHADIHDIKFEEGRIWIACDGGVFFSDDDGTSFQRRMDGIQGTDFWGFGTGFQDGEVLLGGTFHNGTMLKDNQVYTNGWVSTDGGDNFRGFVHPVHQRTVISDYGIKKLSGDRTIANTNSPFLHLPHAGITTGFSGNIAFHPQIYNTLYSTDYYNLWKTENMGLSWEMVYSFGIGLMTSLEISPVNPEIMFLNYHPSGVNDDRKIMRSNDAGNTWVDVTPDTSQIANDRWVTWDIALSAVDSNILWAARISKYEGAPVLDGNQVFESIDGGQSWQNITSSDLDGVFITNIEHHSGSNAGLYLGTRNAVYYKNNSQTAWQLFNAGLPLRTHSVNLVPYYKKGKIRNGTNRSVYECNFYENSPPVAQISVDRTLANCPLDSFYFASLSATRSNAIYSWQFQNGSPTSSSEENPVVVFSGPGTYSVTLTVTDSLGTDTKVLTDFITVSNDCSMDTIPGYALYLTGINDYVKTGNLQYSGNQFTISAWIKPDHIQSQYTGIVTHADDSQPAGLMLNNNNELMFQWLGAQWSWQSGLFVPVDTWSHVAVVIRPDGATVYLNGIPSVYPNNLFSLNWSAGIVIGRYASWISRNFTGHIDEVCIWDKSLTQDEIRETMHLTKYETQEPDLIHYYQFNALTPLVQDRKSTLHAEFYGGGSRTISTAAIGGGSSQKMDVNLPGTYHFSDAFARFIFNASGSLPDGEIVVSRLNVEPNQITGNYLASDGYWIVNNYALNTSFSALDSLVFRSPSAIGLQPESFRLFKRFERAEGNSWGSEIDSCDFIGYNNLFIFSDALNCTSFGQFMIASDSLPVFLSYEPFSEEILPQKVIVYPNPHVNSNQITVKAQFSDFYTLYIYNINGRQIMKKSFNGRQININIPESAKGTCIYSLRSDRHIYNGIIQSF